MILKQLATSDSRERSERLSEKEEMKSCIYHQTAVTTPERARDQAVFITALYVDAPELIAEGIVDLDSSPICCPASGYARSLMKAAFRELLQGEAPDAPEHDLTMPHDIRFFDGKNEDTIHGCPPNCPRRLASEVR